MLRVISANSVPSEDRADRRAARLSVALTLMLGLAVALGAPRSERAAATHDAAAASSLGRR